MTTSKRSTKATTAADIAAAVTLGTMAADAVVTIGASAPAEPTETVTRVIADLSATDHGCGIAGCRHGAAHPAVSQPDRQVKLQCPRCGAVARMTAGAIAKTGHTGIVCGLDKVPFVPATRRAYTARA